MIEKMKFISISGPKGDIDRVGETYLSRYEIQLENALTELKTVQDLIPYVESNPYREEYTKASEFLSFLEQGTGLKPERISYEKAADILYEVDEKMTELRRKRNEQEELLEHLKDALKKIEPYRSINYDVPTLLHFKYIKFRFGKISREYYNKFEKYVYDDLDTVFIKGYTDKDYVWGIYFVPASSAHKIDAVYTSMHFERFYLPDEYQGTPEEAYSTLLGRIDDTSFHISNLNEQINSLLRDHRQDLFDAHHCLEEKMMNFDIRKLAACTRNHHEIFYILCGWMTEKDAIDLKKETEDDPEIFIIVEDDHDNIFSKPPTKLKNPRVFRPFEMFIQMYGLPGYDECDPTIFVALTYAFIFGAMFGDVGQGLCLVIGGALLYKFKKLNLAAIVSCAGIFSTIFGFLFGSFFGFEDILPALWLRPVKHMTDLPFIGRLNTVFVVAIAFGMFLIVVAMIFHIINGVKSKDIENIWFDTNGVAGLVFYGSAVLVIVLFMTGHAMPAAIVTIIMFVLPLLVIACKEPLTRLVKKKKGLIPDGKVMFVVQAFFELFEVLLSYFSNTLSFVRIGAFAVSHAAMMEVVLMLAGAESGSPNWVVVILGNIFVCCLEGLIVGIQVLRLEYYEMFSRFYKGSGREFKPYMRGKSI